jgi:tRNA-splicing ligase RtcB
MPDAHFGYGPPVGSALKTRDAVMPYAVGVDIGCGMMAQKVRWLRRKEFEGKEGRILGRIRAGIPSGVGTGRDMVSEAFLNFAACFGSPPGLDNERVLELAKQRHHSTLADVKSGLMTKISSQFGTLGAGNHFVEVCEGDDGGVWLVLHSGSRGIGNMLATAHVKRAQALCRANFVELEHQDFAWFDSDLEEFDDYVGDMLWCQEYAFHQREEMMRVLIEAVRAEVPFNSSSLGDAINCHHNYADELEPGLWLTRKGAIDASKGVMGVIPGSMGAATYIVRGRGCEEAYNTSPHGAGRLMARGAARRELSIDDFRAQMEGKTWLDRDAEKLLDEAPNAYKPIEQVMLDSFDLVAPEALLRQFVNYKGL